MVDYAFPNISFNSKVVGPAPIKPGWRDNYAIIGEFNRGPVVPVKSSDRAVLASLYGEDTSSGSIALQQAFRQGAVNATVARVVPDSLPSELYFEVAGDSLFVQPSTGYESAIANTNVLDTYNYTTGFKFTLDYIGEPNFIRTAYGEVTSRNTYVDHPTFKGRAQMNYMVTRIQSADAAQRVVYEDDNEVLELTLHNSSRDDYQLVTFAEDNNEYVEQYLKPGFTLRSATSAQQEGLVIASAPYDFGEGVKAVLVKGHYSSTNAYSGTTVSTSGLYNVLVSDFKKGSSVNTPTLSVLAESVALIGGSPFVVSAAATSAGNINVTLATNITGSAKVSAPISFVPKVTGVTYDSINDVTEVTLAGVLSNTDIAVGSKLSFSAKDQSFVVDAISTAWSAGTVTVDIAGDIRANAKVRDYVLVTAADSNDQVDTFKVHYPANTQYIVGYNLRSFDNSSLQPRATGRSYLAVGSSITRPVRYYDGFINYPVDAYLVFQEGDGGIYHKIPYLTVLSNLQEAQLLEREYFGLELYFGRPNDRKLYLSEGTIFNVPIVKSYVVVGGESGTDTAYPKGTLATTILRDLEYALYGDPAIASMVQNIKVDITLVPFKFSAESSFVGVKANRLRWNIERYVAGPKANYASKSGNVLTFDAVPDIILGKEDDYVVVINGVGYPLTAATSTTATIDINDLSDLDILSAGDELEFRSQAQTKDILIRRDPEVDFDVTDYGLAKFFSFLNGRDTAAHAYTDFYALNGRSLVRVVALNPGIYGNNIKVSVIPDEITADSAKFYLQVEDTNPNVVLGGPKTELWYLDNRETDPETGSYLTLKQSNLVRAYFLPLIEPINVSDLSARVDQSLFQALPLRVAPPLEIQDASYASGITRVTSQGSSFIRNINLSGGNEFVDPSPDAAIRARRDGYLAALRAIEKEDIAWVVVAGIYYGDNDYAAVFNELKAQCERATTLNGLRRGIVNLAPNVSPRQAAVLRDRMNSDKIVQIAGSVQGVNLNGQIYQNQGAAGIYAGLRCARPPHISTASTYNGGFAENVSFTNVRSSPDVLDAFTRGGTEVIFYDSGLKLFKFLNGITTSRDPNKKYVSVLEVWDQMKSDLYNYLQYVRSEPNTRDLQKRVASSVDAYLQQKYRDDWFMRIAPTICGPANNTEADMIRGKLFITVRATPTFPADFIVVNDIMDLSETFSFETQPISSY